MEKTYTAEDRLAASKFAVISGKDLLPAQDPRPIPRVEITNACRASRGVEAVQVSACATDSVSASAAHRGSTRTLPPTPCEASVQAQGSDSRHVKRDEFVPKRILFASQHSNTSSGSRHWPPNESFVQTIDSRHVRGDEIIPQTNPFSKLPTRDMQGATKLSPNEFFSKPAIQDT